MNETDIWNLLAGAGTLPVVALDSAKHAVPVATALEDGGIPLIEITLRTPAALDSIRLIADEVPAVRIGAGTVLTADQVDDAVDAGAGFIVSPGLSESVLTRANQHGVAAIPGVATASEVQHALSMGVRLMKFFPAEAAGGTAMLKALAGPFPDAKFVPTGGITAATAHEYRKLPNVLAVGGSWLVTPGDVKEQLYDRITVAALSATTKR